MERTDVFRIIHKYIPPDSPTYPLYVIHCMLVAQRAVEIGQRLGLAAERVAFLEEAAMLHDIGIVATNTPSLFCTGTLPYLMHTVEGAKMLAAEGLPLHARVAERHAKGRIVSCLEGGYSLSALARSVAAHVRVLAGV